MGTHVITASITDAANQVRTATITVTVDATPTVTVDTPANLSVFAPSATVTFTGTATDSEQGDLSAAIVWTSNVDGALGTGASVSTSTLSGGTHTITATVTDTGGKTSTDAITITIDAAPALGIDTPANGAVVVHGSSVTLSGTATDPEDGDLSSTIVWSSSLDGALGTAASLMLGSLGAGTHTITATVTDAAGNTSTATISLTLDVAPVITITTPTDGTTVELGTSVTLEASASDSEDGDLGATIAWSSNIDGSLGVGSTIMVTTFTEASHVVTATVTDSAGTVRTATITLHVVVP